MRPATHRFYVRRKELEPQAFPRYILLIPLVPHTLVVFWSFIENDVLQPWGARPRSTALSRTEELRFTYKYMRSY
jgi:hypothetical protein